MEVAEDVINEPGALTAGQLIEQLDSIYEFIGLLYMKDIDKLIFNELPVYFIVYYKNHWIAIYVSNKQLQVMDSTHSIWEEPHPAFISFLYKNNHKEIQCNPALQSYKSNTCGYYCLFFVKERSRRKSYKEILQNFTTNTTLNDYIVSQLAET